MIGTDLRYTLRWLVRQKLSTSLVVGMLALGIAANVVVFSLVNGLFLRPFPFPEPDRLVYINEKAPRWNLDVVGINYPDFDQWRQAQRAFEAIALYDGASFNLADDRGAERIEGATVTYDFRAVLGVQPLLGRIFTAEEDRPKGPPVVVIGEGSGGSGSAASATSSARRCKLNGVAHTIVGVMPRDAEFPGGVALWVPLAGDPERRPELPVRGIGRLKPGRHRARREKDLLRAQQPIWEARDKERVVSPFARPLREQFVRDFRSDRLGAACRGRPAAGRRVRERRERDARPRDRRAGARWASAWRSARAACGCCASSLSRTCARARRRRRRPGARPMGAARCWWPLGDQVPPPGPTFDFDARIARSPSRVTAVTRAAVWMGAGAARRARRPARRDADAPRRHHGVAARTAHAAAAGRRGVRAGRDPARLRRPAVRAPTTASASVDPGFAPDHVLTFGARAAGSDLSGRSRKRLAFWDRLSERLRRSPASRPRRRRQLSAAGCHLGQLLHASRARAAATGTRRIRSRCTARRPRLLRRRWASGSTTGRFFDDRDTGRKAAARRRSSTRRSRRTFWPGETRIRRPTHSSNGDKSPWITVVGVVGDVKHYGLERPMRPGLYFPLLQSPSRTLSVVIRTAGDPAAFTRTACARARDRSGSGALPVQTMEEALRSLAQRALYSWLLAVFAALALLLALGGTYG